MEKGTKYDNSKRDWNELPFGAVGKIVDVLQFGAKKYASLNWQFVQPYDERYFAACMRHLVAWKTGEKYDKETKMNHLAHAGACILFMLWNEEIKKDFSILNEEIKEVKE